MVELLVAARGIDDARVLSAMREVPRHRFVPDAVAGKAYGDHSLPIGFGQTISQPYVVGRMTQLLAVEPHHRVLEVGCGSGYQAAVLAELAVDVVTIERVPALAEEARARLSDAGASNVEVRVGDGSLGVPEHAPFDGIAVAAAAPRVPCPLYDQLVEGGRLVIPRGSRRGQDLVVVVRTPTGPVERTSIACRFVPLVGDEGFGDD